MQRKTIAIYPEVPSFKPLSLTQARVPVLDTLQRPLKDLRISVTDRCNFRCTYCMPKEQFSSDHTFLQHSDILSFEEIYKIAKVAVSLGVEKIRLTGGEPLLRRDLEVLVHLLSSLKTWKGEPLDISLTTNGVLLEKRLPALVEAGLQRITISLDALDEQLFKQINDMNIGSDKILRAIHAAQEKGLSPVKVNTVVQKNINEHQIIPLVRAFRNTGIILRFIEYMDVGNVNNWQENAVFSGAEILRLLESEFSLEPISRHTPHEVAERWRHTDGSGEIGLITSITQTFCHECSRARLSTDGKLFSCLFASEGLDLRSILRQGASDDEIRAAISHQWTKRNDRYSEIRHTQTVKERKIEMSYIGG